MMRGCAPDVRVNSLLTIPSDVLLQLASIERDRGHGEKISYSRKVFIPLSRLCRDTCRYCTFATTPKNLPSPYLLPDQVLAIAKAGKDAGCREALFTLGDKPELRYRSARDALARLGYPSTVEYLEAMCRLVFNETGLFPHVNAGVMTGDEIYRLRSVSLSQGIMLESTAERLCEEGGAHFGCPDKHPRVRLQMIADAGQLKIPFTTGILIGIGETRAERIEALLALRSMHNEFGHIQEIIVQNFRAKTGTRMAGSPDPDLEELLWSASVARIIFGGEMNIQVPPNLSYGDFPRLLEAGINDWGGVSPVTPDHVNPEAPWPELRTLARATEEAGYQLVERLAAYPRYLQDPAWIDAPLRSSALKAINSFGHIRSDEWAPGIAAEVPTSRRSVRLPSLKVEKLVTQAQSGDRLSELEIVDLFRARECDVDLICDAADALRERVSGDDVTYVVNRNINYTNVCAYKCSFCAFSKGKKSDEFRGAPYDLALSEVQRRVREAWDRGATEVCMQGGIHPQYTGDTYLTLLRAVKEAVPSMHVHAFSPLEVAHGADTLGITVRGFLEKLQKAGLGSLPGTAAEILDDQIRAVICPDKLRTTEWLKVVAEAHHIGLRTTSTMMFGHIEQPVHWARHLLALRDLQQKTKGFTEFVALPFVHMEAPIYKRGLARKGPTWREVRLVHAVARLVLYPEINNIQASWVKLGASGVGTLLRGGVNDLGGTLMNESISRAAGTQHGQELGPLELEHVVRSVGRTPRQRTTFYQSVPRERLTASFAALPLSEPVQTPYRAKGPRMVAN